MSIIFCTINFPQATVDRLAKMKVTCSNVRIRAKLDVLGENHDQEILDLQKKMSKDEQFVVDNKKTVATLTESCSAIGHVCSVTCIKDIENAGKELNQTKLNLQPGFAIAFDNIDGKLQRKHMTKENQNFDFHWVNHKIIFNRVSGNKLDTSPREINAVSNIKFLPSVEDEKRQRHNYIVLVSRILVEHLDCFSSLKEVCIRHIPHKYSKEMAQKSECVSYNFKHFTIGWDLFT